MTATDAGGAWAYLWTYRVKPEQRDAFARAYGPQGEWARFFSQSPGYIRTDLMADASDRDRFVTIDYFKDKGARESLVAAFDDDYRAIDRRWEEATVEERFIGVFQLYSGG